MLSLDYDDTIMAASGHQAEAILAPRRKEKYKGKYILAVEGNPPLNEDGMYCIVGGRPFVDKLKEMAADAKAVIAWGACASYGLRTGRQAESHAGGADRQGDHRQADHQGSRLPADRRGHDRRRHLHR